MVSISVRVQDLANSFQALQRLASTPGIGAAMVLTLARVMRVCEVELQTYDKALHELQNRHVQRDKEGLPIVQNGSYVMRDRLAFNRENDAMLDQEIELPIGRIKLAVLEREKAMPTALEAAALWWLIVDLASEKSDVALLFDEE